MKTANLTLAAFVLIGCSQPKGDEVIITRPVAECVADVDCDDGDDMTYDVCATSDDVCPADAGRIPCARLCAYAPIEGPGCTEDADCDDGDDTSSDTCRDGLCFIRTVLPPPPDAGPPAEDAGSDATVESGSDAGAPDEDAGADAGPLPDAGECTAAPTLTVPDLGFTPGPSHPTGTIGERDVLLGRFQDHLGCEPLDLTQFVLVDDVVGPGQTLADIYQNLKIWMVNADGTRLQVGYTIGTLTDSDAATYTFTPLAAIRRTSGAQTYEVRADVKYGGLLITDDAVVRVERVQSVGVESGEGFDLGPILLQPVWIVAHGRLHIYPDSSTPVARQVAMGQTRVEIFRFRNEAGVEEEVDITRIPLLREGPGNLHNIRLHDAVTDEQFGGTYPAFDADGGVLFDSISNMRVPRSGARIVKALADVGRLIDGAVSGDRFRFVILNQETVEPGAPLVAFRALGVESGWFFTAEDVFFSGNSIWGPPAVEGSVYSSWFTIYQSVLSIARSSASPSGVTSGASEQLVARFVLVNTSPGDYMLTLRLLNLDIGSTIATTAPRTIRVYRDSVTVGNLLASHTFAAGEFFSDTEWTDEEFEDVDMSPGTRDIFVTADTSDAATDKRLTVGIDLEDVIWSDGESEILECDSLPVAGNTLSY